MGTYRTSRNLEKSLMKFVRNKLTEGNWDNVTVVKTFKRASEASLPVICVRIQNTFYDKVEVGSNSIYRRATLYLDIMAENDGQRLDLKDYLTSKLRDGFPYYEYTTGNNQVYDEGQDGRVNIDTIRDEPINFSVSDKSTLNDRDKCRHLIQLDIRMSKVEV